MEAHEEEVVDFISEALSAHYEGDTKPRPSYLHFGLSNHQLPSGVTSVMTHTFTKTIKGT